jgi:hypothetical protein
MKGTFASLEDVDHFIFPLKIIGALVGDNGINIHVFKENDQYISMIPAKNSASGVMVIHKWTKLFSDFEYEEDETRIGILKPNEFMSLFSIFDDNEISFDMDKSGVLTISQDEASLVFQTADPELVKEGKRTFKGCDWLGEFDYDDRCKKFTKALNVMASEQFVFINGKKDTGKIKLTIRNKDTGKNKYNLTLDGTVDEDFEAIFRKENLKIIFEANYDTVKVRIGERLINVASTNSFSETNFYVTKIK